MRIKIFVISLVFMLTLPICVNAQTFEDWTQDDIDRFEEVYGGEPEEFFELGNTEGYTKEQVLSYLEAHPGLLAGGTYVDAEGNIRLLEDLNVPDDSQTVFADGEDEEQPEKENAHIPTVTLAVLTVVLLGGSFAVLVFTKDKSERK